MNDRALAALTLVFLGAAWYVWNRGLQVNAAYVTTPEPLALEIEPQSFTWPSFSLSAPLAAIENTANLALDSIVNTINPNAERNVAAFLAMIRNAEGTAGPDGYRMHFGGELFDSYADHPRRVVTRTLGGRPISSSAAGAYQFLSTTWDEARAALGLPDFSPESQDKAAIFLIRRRGALADVRAGRFEDAVAKVAKEWASMPGSPYGQPVKTLAQVRAVYEGAGGAYA